MEPRDIISFLLGAGVVFAALALWHHSFGYGLWAFCCLGLSGLAYLDLRRSSESEDPKPIA